MVENWETTLDVHLKHLVEFLICFSCSGLPFESPRLISPMSKRPSTTQMFVADGLGGMRQVVDLRTQDTNWPIQLTVNASDAENWMAQLNAEIEHRNWTSSSFTQLDAEENSGSLSIQTAIGQTPPTLSITWERQRKQKLRINARPSNDPVLSVDVANEFIYRVTERVRLGTTSQVHRRVLLSYDGLPWRGELWLDSEHRLGPPTKHRDTLLGSQIVIVDMLVEGIGHLGVSANISKRIRELQLFLGFVLGIHLQSTKFEEGWVCEINPDSQVMESKLGYQGYIENLSQNGLPNPGCTKQVERRTVLRPGLGPYGIHSDMIELWVPSDIEQLWVQFRKLPNPKRDQLLNAANALRCAQMMWPEQRTAYVTFHVVACEALKPKGRSNDKLNMYDVVASLLGQDVAQHFYQLTVHPQKMRSNHLHRGELAAEELLSRFEDHYFGDPSFDQMLRSLAMTTRICLIEWLRRKGNYKLVELKRAKGASAHGPLRKSDTRRFG